MSDEEVKDQTEKLGNYRRMSGRTGVAGEAPKGAAGGKRAEALGMLEEVNEEAESIKEYSFFDTEYMDFSTRSKLLTNLGTWAECGCTNEQLGAFLGLEPADFETVLEKDGVLKATIRGRREIGKARVIRKTYELASAGGIREVAAWVATLQETGVIPRNQSGLGSGSRHADSTPVEVGFLEN